MGILRISPRSRTLKHLPCLQGFMDRYIAEKVAYVNSRRCGKITFSDIYKIHF